MCAYEVLRQTSSSSVQYLPMGRVPSTGTPMVSVKITKCDAPSSSKGFFLTVKSPKPWTTGENASCYIPVDSVLPSWLVYFLPRKKNNWEKFNKIKNVEGEPLVTLVAYSSLESAGNWNQAHCWDAAAGSGHVRGGGKATQVSRRD